jgi:hypothetical protein
MWNCHIAHRGTLTWTLIPYLIGHNTHMTQGLDEPDSNLYLIEAYKTQPVQSRDLYCFTETGFSYSKLPRHTQALVAWLRFPLATLPALDKNALGRVDIHMYSTLCYLPCNWHPKQQVYAEYWLTCIHVDLYCFSKTGVSRSKSMRRRQASAAWLRFLSAILLALDKNALGKVDIHMYSTFCYLPCNWHPKQQASSLRKILIGLYIYCAIYHV